MKKISIFLLALIVLASCRGVVDDPALPMGKDVSFISQINERLSKATDTSFESGDAIGVTAMSGTDVYAENVMYRYEGGKFTSVAPIQQSGELSFSAIYPYAEELSATFEVEEDQSTADNYTLSDLMTAKVDATSSLCPELKFSHRLSLINVDITAAGNISDVKVHAKGAVECDYESDEFAGSGELQMITPCATDENSFKAIVAPQLLSSAETFISFKVDGQEFTHSLKKDVEIESGHRYKCTISISSDGEVVFEGDILDWNDGGDINAGDGSEPEAAFESVTVSDPSENSFTVDVKVGDFDGVYAILPATLAEIAEYDSVEDFVDAFLADDVDMYGTDYSEVDEVYVFSGDFNFDTSTAWTLDSDTEYVALVFGVDGDGTYAEVTTGIVESEVITTLGSDEPADEEYPTDITLATAEYGEILVSDISQNSYDVTYTPNDLTMPYIIHRFTEEEYNTTYPTDEERIVKIYEMMYQSLFTSSEYLTFDELMVDMSEPGVYNNRYTGVDENTTYYIVAFGIDLDTYQPVTKVETESFTTLSASAPRGTLGSIAITDLTFKNGTVDVEVGDYEGYYHVYPVPAASLDDMNLDTGYAGDVDAAMTDAVNYLISIGYYFDITNEDAQYYMFTGDQRLDFTDLIWDVEPDTEYYMLAAGVNSSGYLSTEVLKSEKFSLVDVPVFDVDIEVSNVAERSADISIKPNTTVLGYYYDIMLQSEVDAGATAESVLDRDPFISSHLERGDYEYSTGEVELNPDTEYCVVVFAYELADGTIYSDLFTEPFKTLGSELPDIEMPTEVSFPSVDLGTIEFETVGSRYASYIITPTEGIKHYIQGYMSAYDYDKYESAEAVVLDKFAEIQEEVTAGWEDDYRSSLTGFLETGSQEFSATWLSSETDYVVYAFGVDDVTGLPSTELKVERFTTPASSYVAPKPDRIPALAAPFSVNKNKDLTKVKFFTKKIAK